MRRYIFIILCLALFVRLYRLPELMSFIGDQAWFYLSARDALLHENIPLVGITASRTWLHQGALWTYILMGVLPLTNFHPVAPAIFTAVLGVITTWCVYLVARRIFSEQTGALSALLYATSPLIIMQDRLPYHTTLTPIITLGIFYALHEVMRGKSKWMPVLVVCMVLMYLANLAGIVVWYVVGVFVAAGFLRGERWVRVFFDKKLMLRSVSMAVVLLIPTLMYDVSHGFPQTVKFSAWLISRPFLMLVNSGTSSTWNDMVSFMGETARRLIFYPSVWVAVVICMMVGLLVVRRKPARQLALFTSLTLLGVFINKTTSDAYVQVLFPGTAMLLGYALRDLGGGVLGRVVWLLVGLVGVVNVYALANDSFGVRIPLRVLETRSEEIARERSSYIIRGEGSGAEFKSFTMNVEYLTWWLGNGPDHNNPEKVYRISESGGQLIVRHEALK